jgi:ubiquinone/menaquinone biosynthesis C-methylase UbiE
VAFFIYPIMLQRVPEPEVMDTPEEARDYDAMDHSGVNRVFVSDFLAVWDGRGPVLDVGTGTAQIPVEFCRQSPRGGVVAVDLSEQMLRLAADNLRRAGIEGRVRLEKVNGRSMPFADDSFPAVMSNSIIHHIPEPGDCFAEVVRVAAPGATIFLRDLLRPDDEATLRHLVEAYAANANERQRKMFADSLHAALTLEEVQGYVAELGYDPEAVSRTSDRHWTWAVPGRPEPPA